MNDEQMSELEKEALFRSQYQDCTRCLVNDEDCQDLGCYNAWLARLEMVKEFGDPIKYTYMGENDI